MHCVINNVFKVVSRCKSIWHFGLKHKSRRPKSSSSSTPTTSRWVVSVIEIPKVKSSCSLWCGCFQCQATGFKLSFLSNKNKENWQQKISKTFAGDWPELIGIWLNLKLRYSFFHEDLVHCLKSHFTALERWYHMREQRFFHVCILCVQLIEQAWT